MEVSSCIIDNMRTSWSGDNDASVSTHWNSARRPVEIVDGNVVSPATSHIQFFLGYFDNKQPIEPSNPDSVVALRSSRFRPERVGRRQFLNGPHRGMLAP